MGKGDEVVIDLAELQRRIQALDGMLAKTELLAQLESEEKSAAVVPAIYGRTLSCPQAGGNGLETYDTARDFGRRKVYALLRVRWALARMGRAETVTEKERAAFWITVWSKLKGIRQFKQDRRI